MKGQSGNPEGRKSGTKNQITLLKRDVELALREQALEALPFILQKAIDLAVKGDKTMIKLLIELHMSKAAATDDESAGKDKVTINIRELTTHAQSEPLEVDNLESNLKVN